ncbi:hypothetical protein PG987_004809 [Apiospora arundinis]
MQLTPPFSKSSSWEAIPPDIQKGSSRFQCPDNGASEYRGLHVCFRERRYFTRAERPTNLECVGDESCIHKDADPVPRDFGYDHDFLSDCTLSKSLSQRNGSHFPSFTRWKLWNVCTFQSLLSESGAALSKAPSSRSSSISTSGHFSLDQTHEHFLPPTSVLPLPVDAKKAESIGSRAERRCVLTIDSFVPAQVTNASGDDAVSSCPRQNSLFPASHATKAPQSPLIPSAPLSTRPSHSPFAIEPQSYKPEQYDLAALRQLEADWETARVNYTKYLARVGDHYGTASKFYCIAEQKWARIDTAWRLKFDEVAEAVVSSEIAAALRFDKAQDRSTKRRSHGYRNRSSRAGTAHRLKPSA